MLVSRLRARISSSGFCGRGGLPSAFGAHSSTDRADWHTVGASMTRPAARDDRCSSRPARRADSQGAVFASRDNRGWPRSSRRRRRESSELEAELDRVASRDPICERPADAAQLPLPARARRAAGRALRPPARGRADRHRPLPPVQPQARLRAPATWCSRGVGAVIAAGTRANDLACRIGGDEFAILFPETEHERRPRRARADPGRARGPRGRRRSRPLGLGRDRDARAGPDARRRLLAAAGSALEAARAAGGGQAAVFATDGRASGRRRRARRRRTAT